MTAGSRARALVVAETLAAAAAYLISIWMVHVRIVSRTLSPVSSFLPLSLALAFVIVQLTVIGLLVAVLLGRKWIAEIQERRARRLEPPIVQALAAHSAGADRFADLSAWYAQYPMHVERCLSNMLPSITGTSRDRVSRLAVELGVVARWERQYRSRRAATRHTAITYLGQLSGGQGVPALLAALGDPEPEIRLNAACNVLRSGRRRSDIESVFAFAVRAPLLVRTILADELRRHALVLTEHAIPDRLLSADRDDIIVVLELIDAWGRALPLPAVPALVDHSDRDIRARALRVLPFVGGAPRLDSAILDRLRDGDSRVRAAAAFAAGRMMVGSAGEVLIDCLSDLSPEVRLAAGFALAELGPVGIERLEQQIVSPHRAAGVVALEALERVKIGRCDYARAVLTSG